jgi:hypothetical protein
MKVIHDVRFFQAMRMKQRAGNAAGNLHTSRASSGEQQQDASRSAMTRLIATPEGRGNKKGADG